VAETTLDTNKRKRKVAIKSTKVNSRSLETTMSQNRYLCMFCQKWIKSRPKWSSCSLSSNTFHQYLWVVCSFKT